LKVDADRSGLALQTSPDSNHPHWPTITNMPSMFLYPNFLQRVSIACYAERCISYDRFCL